ncbi:glycoside hydrolase family 43 protein [Lactiplantibacillus mudanjiangensis]|uniref:Glycoside hydrolase 43 family protein [Lactobacillus pentosus] n=1 Tax=Lactiplantibacillus mudanjiangensis TaxID=1296538 RepID=A0A660DVE9_9LACO|nr:glycoside hydrolase family 43 protein [Lactiplantibacillus mudanjiangensis]VDG22508.1 glycoside hydrolase 43 family protein [Lactobacillus pentosus] [Lactiplantibacillus mudanjiangensis]VDG26943.1 glycoside hydrolase 43 family protein [Lactobacillus pentosus] [Lactiplantibacillus mudanjiangensis]
MVTTYQNPVVRGMSPDPSIVRVGSTYYMVNSTFEYYPGIALLRSTDLLNWTRMPGVIQHTTQADLTNAKSNEGIFAVCIRYHQGHFYVITTNFAEFKTFLIRGRLTADGERIEWEPQRTEIPVAGIDPDLYFEDDHTYVQFTGYIDEKGTKAISQVEIDLATGKLLQGPKVLTLGTGGRDVEGPHIIKKAGWYYLLMAEGGTGVGHMITMLRSKELWGPFESPANLNPLFTNRDRPNEPLQNIGHADLFQDTRQNWWLVCLGTRPAQVGFTQITNLGRETSLYPVNWDQDWPSIYTGIPTQTVDLTKFSKHADSLSATQRPVTFTDNFTSSQLKPDWLSLRTRPTTLSLDQQRLTLAGTKTTLSQLATPAFLGLRQTEHNELFQVTIDPRTQANAGQFGIASIINRDHFVALLIAATEDNQYAVYRQQQVADIVLNEQLGLLSSMPTMMTITNHADSKTLSVQTDQHEELSFTTSSLHLSNEAIAALNTGDIQGIYVLDDAKLVINTASRMPIEN